MDDNGYPDDDELQRIEDWPISDIEGLLEFAENLWTYPDRWNREEGWLKISTGGWSGNESVIAALKANRLFWAICWFQSTRGGHYVFDLTRGTNLKGTQTGRLSSADGPFTSNVPKSPA